MNPIAITASALLLILLAAGGCSKTEPPEDRNPLSGGDPLTTMIRAGENTKGTIEFINIERAISAYHDEEGKYPESLDELVEKNYLKSLPPPPVHKQFSYDPATGKFSLVDR